MRLGREAAREIQQSGEGVLHVMLPDILPQPHTLLTSQCPGGRPAAKENCLTGNCHKEDAPRDTLKTLVRRVSPWDIFRGSPGLTGALVTRSGPGYSHGV